MFAFIKKHYHWVIVTLMLTELAVYSGILNNLLSLHLIPVTEELKISRGNFSLGIALGMILLTVSLIVNIVISVLQRRLSR